MLVYPFSKNMFLFFNLARFFFLAFRRCCGVKSFALGWPCLMDRDLCASDYLAGLIKEISSDSRR